MAIRQVDGPVWRGSRPVSAADLAQIKGQFATVISLEGSDEDAQEAAELSPAVVLSRPITFWQIYSSGISQWYLASILSAIRGAALPLLVHCQHGEDRTGLVIAAYRVSRCGWTKDAAFREALSYGYRQWLNFGLNRTWKEFN